MNQMTIRLLNDLVLNPGARASLAHGIEAVAAHTEAPLRVRGHASGDGYEVFDLQEEFELGPEGRRYLLSIDPGRGEMLLLPVGGGRGGSS